MAGNGSKVSKGTDESLVNAGIKNKMQEPK
jgi:hypothetical protein